MESFEITINADTFIIKPSDDEDFTYSVFNHTTCHIIKKNSFGIWQTVQHRFGKEEFPLDEIGEAIDKHSCLQAQERKILQN